MTSLPFTSFDAIMAPLGAEAFKRDHLGRGPVHIEGAADKWAAVMNWDVLGRLLGTNTIWSAASLPMVLDKEPIPPTAYASPAPGRDGGTVLRPEPAKVKALLRQGATLVANDIDQLTPELGAFSRSMEEGLGGKVQGNLYLSSKRRQGFRVHFDTHDVFAVHVMGEKVWTVFEGRTQDPIAHPAFKTLGQDHHEQAKGALWREVRLRPGDLLYLPRGQYHYALADEGPCAHIAFGVTFPIGLDVVSWLFERLVHEPLARANLPQGDHAALAQRLAALGSAMAALLREPRAATDLAQMMAGFRYDREGYDLPALIETAPESFAVRGQGMRLVEQGGRFGLVKAGSREAVEVPATIKDMVAWTLQRERFALPELASAFPAVPRPALDRFLADMRRMKLVEAAA